MGTLITGLEMDMNMEIRTFCLLVFINSRIVILFRFVCFDKKFNEKQCFHNDHSIVLNQNVFLNHIEFQLITIKMSQSTFLTLFLF